MQTFYKNNKTHKEKLEKSINNKLFDLLIDLDGQLAQGYEHTDLNIMLKYYIMTKLIIDRQAISGITFTAIKQNVAIARTNDNNIYIDRIETITEYEPNKYCPQVSYKHKYDKGQNIIKRYEIDFEPLRLFAKNKRNITMKIDYPRFKILKIDRTNTDNYIHKNVSQFNNKLNIYLPPNVFEDSDSEDDKEQKMQSIKNPYTPYILTGDDKDKMQQLTQFIGKKSENHRDKDRQKHINKLLGTTPNGDL